MAKLKPNDIAKRIGFKQADAEKLQRANEDLITAREALNALKKCNLNCDDDVEFCEACLDTAKVLVAELFNKPPEVDGG